MIFQAPFLVASLGLLSGWRQLGIAYRFPLWAQYFTPLYIVIFIFLVETTWQICRILYPTGWLDLERTKELVSIAPASVNITLWEEEVGLEDLAPLMWLHLSMPVWVMGTFITCLVHTLQHVGECHSGNLACHHQRDMTIILLALPAIYGVMSLRAVMDVWFVVTNTSIGVHRTWEDLKDFFWDAFESNFMVADVYESVALFVFARIAMFLIRAKVRKYEQDEMDTVDTFAEELSGHRFESFSLNEALPVAPLRRSFTGGLERTNKVVGSLSSQMLLAIKYFCVACCSQAFYNLTKTSFSYIGHPIMAMSAPERKATAHTFFLGMGTVSSFAAIHSIVVLERAFGHTYFVGFAAGQKFMSAKVLVSISFLQTLVLMVPPFSSMSETKQKLLYSSALCFECFLISIFHVYAWSSSDRWFNEGESVALDSAPLIELKEGSRTEVNRHSGAEEKSSIQTNIPSSVDEYRNLENGHSSWDFWFPSWDAWKFQRTLTYWISVMYLEGALLYLVGTSFALSPYEQDARMKLALVQTPNFVGGVCFTIGSYLGVLEVLNLRNDGSFLIFCPCRQRQQLVTRNGAPLAGYAAYLIGGMFYNVGDFVGFYTLSPIGETLAAVAVVSGAFLGGLGYLCGSWLECRANQVWKMRLTSCAWWLSVGNLMGSLGYITSGLSLLFNAHGLLYKWLVDVPYLVGSGGFVIGALCTMWLWKSEQYGLGFIPEMNVDVQRQEPQQAVLAIHAEYGCGRASVWQLPFLTMYLINATASVLNSGIAFFEPCTQENTEWQQRIFEALLSFALSHGVMFLGSIVHHVPTMRPHSWLLIYMRVVLLMYTFNSWVHIFRHLQEVGSRIEAIQSADRAPIFNASNGSSFVF